MCHYLYNYLTVFLGKSISLFFFEYRHSEPPRIHKKLVLFETYIFMYVVLSTASMN